MAATIRSSLVEVVCGRRAAAVSVGSQRRGTRAPNRRCSVERNDGDRDRPARRQDLWVAVLALPS